MSDVDEDRGRTEPVRFLIKMKNELVELDSLDGLTFFCELVDGSEMIPVDDQYMKAILEYNAERAKRDTSISSISFSPNTMCYLPSLSLPSNSDNGSGKRCVRSPSIFSDYSDDDFVVKSSSKEFVTKRKSPRRESTLNDSDEDIKIKLDERKRSRTTSARKRISGSPAKKHLKFDSESFSTYEKLSGSPAKSYKVQSETFSKTVNESPDEKSSKSTSDVAFSKSPQRKNNLLPRNNIASNKKNISESTRKDSEIEEDNLPSASKMRYPSKKLKAEINKNNSDPDSESSYDSPKKDLTSRSIQSKYRRNRPIIHSSSDNSSSSDTDDEDLKQLNGVKKLENKSEIVRVAETNKQINPLVINVRREIIDAIVQWYLKNSNFFPNIRIPFESFTDSNEDDDILYPLLIALNPFVPIEDVCDKDGKIVYSKNMKIFKSEFAKLMRVTGSRKYCTSSKRETSDGETPPESDKEKENSSSRKYCTSNKRKTSDGETPPESDKVKENSASRKYCTSSKRETSDEETPPESDKEKENSASRKYCTSSKRETSDGETPPESDKEKENSRDKWIQKKDIAALTNVWSKKNKETAKTFSPYTTQEDRIIIDWILTNNNADLVNGTRIWKRLEALKLMPHTSRTWMSLRNRYLRTILRNIRDYGLSKEKEKKLVIGFEKGELKHEKLLGKEWRSEKLKYSERLHPHKIEKRSSDVVKDNELPKNKTTRKLFSVRNYEDFFIRKVYSSDEADK